MLRSHVIRVALGIVTLAGASHAQHGGGGHGGPRRSPAPVAVEVPRAGVTVPMRDVGGRPLVDVRINGRGPYRFILDTGASITVIDETLKGELSLPTVPGMHAAPGHGPTPTIVSVDSLAVAGATLRGVTAALMPLGRMFAGDPRPQGVLNASSFPGHLVTVDYPGRRIAIAKGALGEADQRSTFSYDAEDPLPNVPLRIAGREARVHLDTGSGYGIMLPTRFLEELPLASKPVPAGKAKTHAGEAPITMARVNGAIQLGGFTLDSTDVRFVDLKHGFAASRGNIGYQVLRRFVVTLDSRNRRIRLRR